MPNTLAHIGAQVTIGRSMKKPIDPRWISLGLIIPDLPWIFQRFTQLVFPSLPGVEQRAYFVVQSSPLFCALLSLTIAICFQNSIRVFAILFTQSLLHLIMDAAQIKYGAAIPFFGPMSWKGFSFGFYSMDGWITHALTIAGVLVILIIASGKMKYPPLEQFQWKSIRRLLFAGLLLLVYFLAPPVFKASILKSNLNDLGVWSNVLPRVGQTVHFDRAHYESGEPGLIFDQMQPEGISIEGIESKESILISASATFLTENKLQVNNYIVHPNGARFTYSLIGLVGVCFIWLYPVFIKTKT